MATPDNNNKLYEIVDMVKSWIPRRTEPANLSKDFWMPDQSCRVCYDCDSQFTIFNRRHHCRLCGRVFCAKCTENSIPVASDESKASREDWERIRVCNYCFKQWEQGITTVDNATSASTPGLSPSPSAVSLVSSTQSSCTCNSSISSTGSTMYSTGPYKHVQCSTSQSSRQCVQVDPVAAKQDQVICPAESDSIETAGHLFPNQFGYCANKSDDEDDEYGVYRSHSETTKGGVYCDVADYNNEIGHSYGPDELCPHGENITSNSVNSDILTDNLSTQDIEGIKKLGEEVKVRNTRDECEPPLYDVDGTPAVPMDFEENRLLWLPPEPEAGEDEREGVLFDDDDDDAEDFRGEWGYLRLGSFGSEEHNSNRDRSNEVHRKAMKNVVDGHFRSLILQLLQVENLPVGEKDKKESWLDIITSLSWEAATLLKPDTSKGGGMDPGGYVKVKCIPCGHRCESMVVKGIVCKKNVANKRMTSKIEKPRFLILGGALEYQRVANHLSSFDTLLQQETDHLKMAVAKIDAHHPNVLLVEKSVSRFAQEYLLAKDISLVLNIKRPLLERIARCTGAQVVPSIDHLTSQKLGYCDSFHVEKFLEEHVNAGQGGKKLTKTLMFFEGCPKPLGCTILLKGGSEDELKKVKHVVQYGVFAAYHLALETSFLADEGASLPELPLKSPITVALPDKPLSIDRSISTIPGFTIAAPEKLHRFGEPYRSNSSISSDISSSLNIIPSSSKLEVTQPFLPKGPTSQMLNVEPAASNVESSSASVASIFPSGYDFYVTHQNGLSSNYASEENNNVGLKECSEAKISAAAAKIREVVGDDNVVSDCFAGALGQVVHCYHSDNSLSIANCSGTTELPSQEQDYCCNNQQEVGSSKDEFPPSTSNHQSILVSLSTRCVWKGTVCERAHLIRIKYYGSFDMPLGRFLRDNMFDKSYRCHSCEMPSEAHVHCYTHQQGSLTISVKKLPEFVLPGEREGKIWMWHRCLRCPRINGFPPATRRVVMSDAAWGLSFGKFLELSFSNHAAASRVANCGHSLHRDCLRFYGFGRMVACFRYASIDVHSVYLPPAKLEFNHANQEWIQREADEVRSSADHLFPEVYHALHKISEKILAECVMTSPSSRQHIAEVETMLQREKYEFEASLQQLLNKDVNVGEPAIDILEINRLRKQLIFLSYAWDQRLIYLSSLSKCNLQEGLSIFLPKLKEKSVRSCEKPAELNTTSKAGRRFSSSDSFLLDARKISPNQTENCGAINKSVGVHKRRDTHEDLSYSRNETRIYRSSTANVNNQVNSLDPGGTVRRVLSEGRFPMMENLSDTLDAAWTGESHPSSITPQESDCAARPNPVTADSSSIVAEPVRTDSSVLGNSKDDRCESELGGSFGLPLPAKGPYIMDNSMSWLGMPFSKLYHSLNEVFSSNVRKLRSLYEYNPVYVLPFRELLHQGGARLLLPEGITDTVVPVYDDEPTSCIAYALVSPDYQIQMSEDPERLKNGTESSVSLPILDAANLLSLNSFTESASESLKSLGSTDESVSGSRGSSGLDIALYSKSLHPRVSFTDEGPLGKVKYTVTFYYAKRFEALRKTCCPSELDFIRSLSRCKKWGAQGGKSNVFFAKTLDDRFIIKQVTKTELESFIKFAPGYFKYLTESISMGSPTCLAKILGIYQVTMKHLKGGKESRMDVLVMENLLFRRNITRLYDLKGSSRSRYNPDSSGSNKVLLDQNLIEAMPTSPIFVGNKAKRLLERAVWNDTAFLASADVMDYSLLVGVDEEKHELVLGIIDFMRQYTWDKHLETWVKASGILGGPKNSSPTVISPKQYKKRFRKAMSAYFVMVPDQWSPPTIIPSRSQSDLCQENNR